MRPSRPRSRVAAAAAGAAVAAVAAGCGAGGGGTITVVAAAPSSAQLARATALAAPADALPVGPRAVRVRVRRAGYAISVGVSPNRASASNRLSVSLAQDGVPVAGARVEVDAGMLEMDMGVAAYDLYGSGTYRATAPAWLMAGLWRLAFTVRPPGHAPIRVVLDDRLRR